MQGFFIFYVLFKPMGIFVMLVAVYGSLKKNHFNHDVLAGAEFIAAWKTTAEYTMFDLGGFPGVVAGGTTSVHAEIYKITPEILEHLDRLEGHPTFYRRTPIDSPFGEIQIYLYLNTDCRDKAIESGLWKDSEGSGNQRFAKPMFTYQCSSCDNIEEKLLNSIRDVVMCNCGEAMERKRP